MSNHREEILVKLVGLMESCSFVASVTRDNPSFNMETYIKSVSNAVLPRIAITSSSPTSLDEKQEARKSWGGKIIRFNFDLIIDIYGIAIWPTDADVEFGKAINEIHQKLFTNHLLDGLVTKMKLIPSPPPILLDPYYIFKLTLNARYYTDGGI